MNISSEIRFSFENKRYSVNENAYNTNHIELPDGRTLKVGYWRESYPPQPAELNVVVSAVKGEFATEIKD